MAIYITLLCQWIHICQISEKNSKIPEKIVILKIWLNLKKKWIKCLRYVILTFLLNKYMIWDPWVIFDIPIHPNPEKFDFEPALTKKIVTQKRHFLPFFCLWLYFLDISVQKRPIKPIFFGKLVKFPIICHQKHVHTTKLLTTRLFFYKNAISQDQYLRPRIAYFQVRFLSAYVLE